MARRGSPTHLPHSQPVTTLSDKRCICSTQVLTGGPASHHHLIRTEPLASQLGQAKYFKDSIY